MQKYFLIGIIITDKENTELGWMAEGLFLTEQEAVTAIKQQDNELMFLVEVTPGMFPKHVLDIENTKLYFPLSETWEDSKLYKLRTNVNAKKTAEDPVIDVKVVNKELAGYSSFLLTSGAEGLLEKRVQNQNICTFWKEQLEMSYGTRLIDRLNRLIRNQKLSKVN